MRFNSAFKGLITEYYLGDQFKNDRAGLVAPAGYKRGAHRVLVRRSDGSSRFGDEAAWIVLLSLSQDRNRWWALINVVINLRVNKIRGISSLANELLASQEGLCPED
jgi:hypothetical protein